MTIDAQKVTEVSIEFGVSEGRARQMIAAWLRGDFIVPKPIPNGAILTPEMLGFRPWSSVKQHDD